MKVARKTLSVFLSFLMVLTSVSVAFTALDFTAFADAKTDLQTALTSDVVNNINTKGTTPGNNTYSYTGDDGSVMRAFDAAWDYFESKSNGTDKNNVLNTQTGVYRTLYAKGSDSSDEAQAVKKLLNPAGLVIHSAASPCGSDYRNNCMGYSTSNDGNGHSVAADCEGKHHAIYSKTNNAYLHDNTSIKGYLKSWIEGTKYLGQGETRDLDDMTYNVVSSVNVKADLTKYLLACNSVADISSDIHLDETVTVSYNRVHDDYTYSLEKKNAITSYYSYAWNEWHERTGYTRTVNQRNTTAKNELTSIKNFYDSYVVKSDEEILTNAINGTWNIDSLVSQGTSLSTTLASYGSDVANHLIGQDSIDAFNSFNTRAAVIQAAAHANADIVNIYNQLNAYNNLVKNANSWKTYDDTYRGNIQTEISSAQKSLSQVRNTRADAFQLLLDIYPTNPAYKSFKIQKVATSVNDDDKLIADSIFTPANVQAAIERMAITMNKNIVYARRQAALDHMDGRVPDYTDLLTQLAAADNTQYKAIIPDDIYADAVADATNFAIEFVNPLNNSFAAIVSLADRDTIVSPDERTRIDNYVMTYTQPIIDARDGENTFASIYVDKGFSTQLFVDVTTLTDDILLDYYENALTYKDQVASNYTNLVYELTKNNMTQAQAIAIADGAYRITYKTVQKNFKDCFDDRINNDFLTTLKVRDRAMMDNIAVQFDAPISFNNFALKQSAVQQFNQRLFNLGEQKGWHTPADKNNQTRFQEILDQVATFKANGLGNWTEQHQHDVTTGIFTTRYAEYMTDEDGNKTSNVYPDFARKAADADNDYEVTAARVDETVVKLDTFLKSKQLVETVGIDSYKEYQKYDADVTDPATGEVIHKAGDNVLDADGNKIVTFEKPINNLSEYIEVLLVRKLFTNDMITELFVAIYPTVTNLVSGVLNDLPGTLNKPFLVPGGNGNIARIDLPALFDEIMPLPKELFAGTTLKSIKGSIDIYMDGQKGTCKFEDIFSELGIKLYPKELSSCFTGSAFSSLRSELYSAGRDWSNLAVSGATDKSGNKKLVASDIERLLNTGRWGVWESSYDPGQSLRTFEAALGLILNPIGKLLNAVLTDTPLTTHIDNAAFIKNDEKIDTSGTGLFASTDINTLEAMASKLNITIGKHIADVYGKSGKSDVVVPYGDTPPKDYDKKSEIYEGLDLFGSLLVPLLEDFGVAEGGYTPNLVTNSAGYQINSKGEYQFRTLSDSSSTDDMITAILEPVLVLMDQIIDHPIQRICELLPNLMYFLSMDKIGDIINSLNINITIGLGLESDKVTLKFSGAAVLLQPFVDIFKPLLVNNILGGFLKFINVDLKISSLLDLKSILNDKLGIADYTDINSIIGGVLKKVGLNINLPALNAGKMIECSTLGTHLSSQASNRTERDYLYASNHEIFYYLLSYIVEVLGNKPVVTAIYNLAAGGELPEQLGLILDQIHGRPKDVLAAIIELFVPNEATDGKSVYQPLAFDRYEADPNLGSDIDVASKVYVSDKIYGGNWSKAFAKNLVDNLGGTIQPILDALGVTIPGGDLGAFIKDKIWGLFEASSIASPIRIFVELGQKLKYQEQIVNILQSQTGIGLTSWYDTYNTLFSLPILDADGKQTYTTDADGNQIPAKTVVADLTEVSGADINGKQFTIIFHAEKGTKGHDDYEKSYYSLTYDGKDYDTEIADDDKMDIYTSMICTIFKDAAPLLGLLLSGTDIKLFSNALVLKGFDGYGDAIYDLLACLGVQNLPTKDNFASQCHDQNGNLNNAGCVAAFNSVVQSIFKRIEQVLMGNDMIGQVLDMVDGLFYYIESNGLSTLIHNLLQPVLVLIDIVRPIANIDLNHVVNVLLAMILDGKTVDPTTGKVKLLNTDNLDLMQIVNVALGKDIGVQTNYNFDIWNLRLEDLLPIIDRFLGTDLRNAPIIKYGMLGLCNGIYDSTNHIYEYIPPEDTLTILVSTLLDSLIWGKNTGIDINTNAPLTDSNGHILCQFIDKAFDIDLSKLGRADLTITELYDAVIEVFRGLDDNDYDSPSWFYGFGDNATLTSVMGTNVQAKFNANKATNSAVYLDYNTNWKKSTAETLDSQLTTLVNAFTKTDDPNVSKIQQLISELMTGKVYTSKIFDSLISMVYGLVNGTYRGILEIAGPILGIGVSDFLNAWGDKTKDADGNDVYTYNFDKFKTRFSALDDANATETQKRAAFLDAFKTVLEPVDSLLSFLLFGTSYGFFTSSATDPQTGEFTYDQIIKLAGGDGYSTSLAYLLEVLGCKGLKNKSFYENKDNNGVGNGTYRTSECVADILGSVLDLLDKVAENPIDNAMGIIANLIYFVNADGLSVFLGNLLAPVEKILQAVMPVIGKDDMAGVLLLVKTILKQKADDLGDDVKNILDTLDLDSVTDFRDLLNFRTVIKLVSTFTGIKFNDAVVNMLDNFYIGKLVKHDSEADHDGMFFTMEFNAPNEDGSRADFITILLSIVIETMLMPENEPFIEGLLDKNNPVAAQEKYNALLEVLTGATMSDADYFVPNYDYMDDKQDTSLDMDDTNLTAYVQKINDLYHDAANPQTIVYVNDHGDWTSKTAEELVGNIDAILDSVLAMINKDDPSKASIAGILKDAIDGNLYGDDSVLNKIVPLIANAIAGLAKTLADSYGLEISNLYGLLKDTLGVDIAEWMNMCEEKQVVGDDGKVTTTLVLKADKKITGVTAANFGDALDKVLRPVNGLIKWLFFGGDYTFFNDSTSKTMVTLKGGLGWSKSILYLMRTLGLEGLDADYADMDTFIKALGSSLAKFLEDLGDEPVAKLISILPNLLYFIGADGLTTVVTNLLKPVSGLISRISIIAGKDIGELLNNLIKDYGLTYASDGTIRLDYDTIFAVVDKLAGIKVPAQTQAVLKNLYIGELQKGAIDATRKSVNMFATTPKARGDFLTVIICVAGDIIRSPENKQPFMKLLNITEAQYDSIISLLDGTEVGGYEQPDWGYFDPNFTFDMTDFDKQPQFPQDTYTNCAVYLKYANSWSKETADTLMGMLGTLLDTVAKGMDKNHPDENNIGTILANLLNDKLYSASTFKSLIATLYKYVNMLNVHLINAVGLLLGADMISWLERYGKKGTDGSYTFDPTKIEGKFTKATFVDDIVALISPLDKLFGFLLLGDSFELFTTTQKPDGQGGVQEGTFLTLAGGRGYSQGFVYLFEALGIRGFAPESKYMAIADKNVRVETMLKDILNCVFDFLDGICANGNDTIVPAALDIVTNLIYFINAKGLGTVIDNIIAPLTAVLGKVGPLVGDKTSIVAFLKDTLEGVGLTVGNNTTFKDVLTLDNVLSLLESQMNIYVPDDCKELLTKFYIGSVERIENSGTGYPSYAMKLNRTGAGTGNSVDLVTIVLSLLLDIIDDTRNDSFLLTILNQDQLNGIRKLFQPSTTPDYTTPNWTYFDGDPVQNVSDFDKYIAKYNVGLDADGNQDPAGVQARRNSCTYLKYKNLWNSETVEPLIGGIDTLVDAVLDLVGQGSLGTLLQGLLNDKVYGPDNSVLVSLLELVVNAVSKYKGYLGLIDVVLGTEVQSYFDEYCGAPDADGKYHLKDTVAAKLKGSTPAEFGKSFAYALKPLDQLLSWLFLGTDYKFFYGVDGKDQIYLPGGNGYEHILTYLLDMLGVENLPSTTEVSGDIDLLLEKVGTAVAQRLYDLTQMNTASGVLELLPNIVYFIGANGLGTIVSNLIAPFNGILDLVNGFMKDDSKIDVSSLLYTITKNEALKGIDITKIDFATIISVLSAFGITVPQDILDEVHNNNFVTLEKFTNGVGHTEIKALAKTAADKTDFLTVLISFVLDVLRAKENKSMIVGLLGDDGETKYDAIVSILDGEVNAKYVAPDWGYMDPNYHWDILDLDNTTVPTVPSDITQSVIYEAYNKHWSLENNWNQETAELLLGNLYTILDGVLDMLDKDDIRTLLKNLVDGNIYSSSNFSAVFKKIYDALASLDSSILSVLGLVTDGDKLSQWLDKYGVMDANGNRAYNENYQWSVSDKASFTATLVEALSPLDTIMEFLFLGGDIKLFYQYTGADAIVIRGGEGYDNALVYILEALGIKLDERETGWKAADMERSLINGVLTFAETVCKDPVRVVLNLLPNLLYFINNKGLGAAIQNLLAPVDAIVAKITPFTGSAKGDASLLSLLAPTLEEKLGLNVAGKELMEIVSFDTVFQILEDKLGIVVPSLDNNINPGYDTQRVIKEFFVGKINSFKSANKHSAFRMEINDVAKDGAVELTVLVGIVIDILKVQQNIDVLRDKLGDNGKYADAIANVLKLDSDSFSYKPFNWLFEDLADKKPAQIITALSESRKYADPYQNQEYWTKEMSWELVTHLDRFIGNLLCLLGVSFNGKKVESLETLVQGLLDEKVFTKDNVEKIIDLINTKLMGMLREKLGDELTEILLDIVKECLGVDLRAYEGMKVEIEVNSPETFETALTQVLTPLLPLLNVVLNNKSLTFFYDYKGMAAITVPGSDGYAYGIIPLFEALGVEGKDIMTPATFAAIMDSAVASNNPVTKEKAVKAILDPLIKRIKVIAANPVEELFSMLPELIYFINTNGVDTVLKNIVGGIDAVLGALQPITGEQLELMTIIKIKGTPLKNIIVNFETVIDFVLGLIKNNTGIALKPLIMDAVSELTVGTLVSYDSANGDKGIVNAHYYKMLYTTGDQNTKEETMADTLTVILRILVDFITDSNNMAKVKQLLKDLINNDKTFGYVEGLLDALANAKADDPTIAMALQLIYKLYQALEKAVDDVDVGYHDYNNAWGFLVEMIASSDEPLLKYLGLSFKEFLDKNVDPDMMDDTHAVAPNGFIKFFQAIANFFKKIGEFFKKLFKIN